LRSGAVAQEGGEKDKLEGGKKRIAEICARCCGNFGKITVGFGLRVRRWRVLLGM